jgi:hypothetical protein
MKCFFSGIYGSKRDAITWDVMKTMPITFFYIKAICLLWIHSTRPNIQPNLLCGNTEAVIWNVHRKRPEIWSSVCILNYDKSPAHKALSVKHFLAQNRLLKWNTHPIPLIGSEWLLAVYISKVWRFRDIEDIQKGECDDSTESYSTSRVPKIFPTVATSLI